MTTNIQKKRGRPPLSTAKKMQRAKAMQNARAVHKALRTKIALLKANFKEKLKVATQEAYQKALEKVVKIERKKMEANYKALALAKAKFSKKTTSSRNISERNKLLVPNKKPAGLRKRGRPRKVKA